MLYSINPSYGCGEAKSQVLDIYVSVSLAERGTPRHLRCHPPSLGGL